MKQSGENNFQNFPNSTSHGGAVEDTVDLEPP